MTEQKQTIKSMVRDMREMASQILSVNSTGKKLFNDVADALENTSKRLLETEELLRSAHCIADRKGEETHWERFAASIEKLGVGSVTARTYRILPSDLEEAEMTATGIQIKNVAVLSTAMAMLINNNVDAAKDTLKAAIKRESWDGKSEDGFVLCQALNALELGGPTSTSMALAALRKGLGL